MIRLSAKEQQRLTDILNYWHKIEFFTPFDLSSHLTRDHRRSFLPIPTGQAEETEVAGLLPARPPKDRVHTGYRLFMSCFPSSAIAEVCEKALGKPSEFEQYTAEERSTGTQETCFAEFRLTPEGLISIEDFKVSTVPWALGMVKAGRIDALRGGSFDKAVTDLWQALRQLDFGRREHDHRLSPPLTLGDIRDLHEVLCNWAGFTPEGEPLAYLQVNPYVRNGQSCPEPETGHAVPDNDPDTDDEDDQDNEQEDDHDVTILNSFHVQDLETALSLVSTGSIPKPSMNT